MVPVPYLTTRQVAVILKPHFIALPFMIFTTDQAFIREVCQHGYKGRQVDIMFINPSCRCVVGQSLETKRDIAAITTACLRCSCFPCWAAR